MKWINYVMVGLLSPFPSYATNEAGTAPALLAPEQQTGGLEQGSGGARELQSTLGCPCFGRLGCPCLKRKDPRDAMCPPPGFASISAEKFAEQGGLDAYISDRWFIQQQQEVRYLPKENNFCVSANYKPKTNTGCWEKLMNYNIDVSNYSEFEDGRARGGNICAQFVDVERGQLKVAPCVLPPGLFAGPYWILDFNEEKGYALISGGPPKFAGEDNKCKNGSGINDSGTWIFTRCPNPPQSLIDAVRTIASETFGLDVSVLNQVEHHAQCRYNLSDEDYSALRTRLDARGCAPQGGLSDRAAATEQSLAAPTEQPLAQKKNA